MIIGSATLTFCSFPFNSWHFLRSFDHSWILNLSRKLSFNCLPMLYYFHQGHLLVLLEPPSLRTLLFPAFLHTLTLIHTTSAALCKKKRRVSCHCVNITTGARPVSFRHHQLRPHTIQRLAGSPRIPEEQHNTIHVVPPAPTHASKASKIHEKEKRDFRLPNISTKLHTRFRRKSAGDVTTVS